jgi:hypothetical protein
MNEEITLIDLGDATVETKVKQGPRLDNAGQPDIKGFED